MRSGRVDRDARRARMPQRLDSERPGRPRIVIAHVNDGSALITDLRDGSVLKELSGIPTARRVAVAADARRRTRLLARGEDRSSSWRGSW